MVAIWPFIWEFTKAAAAHIFYERCIRPCSKFALLLVRLVVKEGVDSRSLLKLEQPSSPIPFAAFSRNGNRLGERNWMDCHCGGRCPCHQWTTLPVDSRTAQL